MFSDLTSITTPKDLDSALCKTVWHMAIEQYTGFKASASYSKKNDYLKLFFQTLLEWSSQGLGIKYVQHDDAGKNKAFIKVANGPKRRLHLLPDFTSVGVPQHNQLVELGFTLASVQAWAILYKANLPSSTRHALCCKALNTAMLLSNLQVMELDGKLCTRYEHFYGQLQSMLQIYADLEMQVQSKLERMGNLEIMGFQ